MANYCKEFASDRTTAKPVPPCKDCENHSPTCHSKCPEYQEFEKQIEVFRFERYKESHSYAHDPKKIPGVVHTKSNYDKY